MPVFVFTVIHRNLVNANATPVRAFAVHLPNWMFEELGKLLAILTIILLAERLTADNRIGW